MISVKRLFVLILALMLLCVSPAFAAKKAKDTPTPPPMVIQEEPADPPELIQRLLEIAYSEWTEVNGADQGEMNKYTTWFNKYKWGRNKWCAGFVTYCMLAAEIPQLESGDLKAAYPEGTAPEPVFHIKASSPGKMFPGYQYMHRTSTIPQKGYVVLYGEGTNKYVHVGIVYDVQLTADGKYRLTCIEGAMKNTVKIFVYDYDPAAEMKKNITLIPESDRTEEERKNYSYEKHSKKNWYVNCFLVTWVPGDTED